MKIAISPPIFFLAYKQWKGRRFSDEEIGVVSWRFGAFYTCFLLAIGVVIIGTCLAIAVLDVWFPLLYPSVTPIIVLFMLYIPNLRKTKKQRQKIRNQMWE